MEGEETELDQTLIEAISASLTHLVRNCVDRGIEPFLETYDYLYKSMIFLLIICSILASTWQRRRYPVHKLIRANCPP